MLKKEVEEYYERKEKRKRADEMRAEKKRRKWLERRMKKCVTGKE